MATVCYWKSCCQQSIFSGFGNQQVTIWDTTFFLICNNDKLICMFDVAERGKFARHNIFPYSCLCMKPMLSCSLTPSQRANWISNCFLYMINLEVKVWSSIKNSNFTFSKTCRSFFFLLYCQGWPCNMFNISNGQQHLTNNIY